MRVRVRVCVCARVCRDERGDGTSRIFLEVLTEGFRFHFGFSFHFSG